ncbi:MAG: 23S rRNA (uracil(1939)-C(5))-methyltransferase RlmD [Legionellaceae bacterium]|nr:23S rRNA (uracil(1939)-C(5))-methyltransferase RlmD [Legionellaceae bacterium]
MRKRRQTLPKAPVTAYVEKFSHDGRGIARLDGKTTFIEGALAQETVTFEYTRRKSDYDEGRLLTVITPSEQRVEPKCPHYAMCGGCSLQHLDGGAQIIEKQTLLLDVLARVGHCQPETVLAPLTSDQWHYRNKARLSVRYVDKKQATLVGFREKNNPRYITDIHTCLVLHARVDAEMDNIRQLLDTLDDLRCIAQIEVAAGDDDVAFILRNLTPLSQSDEEKIKVFADRTHFRIFLQPGGPDSVYLFHPTNVSEFLTYRLPQFGIEYQFHPTDFTQVNAGINRLMVPLALQLLDLNANDVVLDLFCGLGNFSLPLATQCAHVIAVEGSDAMVRRADMNAKANQLTNVTFLCANLDDEAALRDEMCAGVNKILLDPPRTGALAIVKQMDKINPQCIVYVSCNPATLARDADILVNQHGYCFVSAGVMDMFPHTSHVESIALFVRD